MAANHTRTRDAVRRIAMRSACILHRLLPWPQARDAPASLQTAHEADGRCILLQPCIPLLTRSHERAGVDSAAEIKNIHQPRCRHGKGAPKGASTTRAW